MCSSSICEAMAHGKFLSACWMSTEHYLHCSVPGLGGHHKDTVMGSCIHHKEGNAGDLIVQGCMPSCMVKATFTVLCLGSPLIVPWLTGMLSKSKESMLANWKIQLGAALLFPPHLQSPLGFAAFCPFLSKNSGLPSC